MDVATILYIEAVDRKTFVYTEKGVYESDLRLYELEEQLEEYGFFRAGRSCLIQLHAIKSLKRDINRRIRVTMENGEVLMVSRQYSEALKKDSEFKFEFVTFRNGGKDGRTENNL